MLRNLGDKVLAVGASTADCQQLSACELTPGMVNCEPALIHKLIKCRFFLSSEGAVEFLGRYFGCFDDPGISIFFWTFDKELSSCKEQEAVTYAKVILDALFKNPDRLKSILKIRLANLIRENILMIRKAVVPPRRGRNLLQFINVWNVEVRKKAQDDITMMMTDCYQPILWKYLQTGWPSERCNAADLFLKAFPLRIPGDARASQELFDKQIEHMIKALRDNCWIVRVIAIREILSIIPVYWSEFKPEQIKKLMDIIMDEDARDISTPKVRCAVWVGLTNFVKHREGLLYLKQIIPSMSEYIRDFDVEVRKAFIQLLIAMREEEHMPLSDVIDYESCIGSIMHEEDQDVCRLVVKLLMPDIYHDEMPAETWFMNVCNLISSPTKVRYRNVFLFSKNALAFEQAAVIMTEILHRLGKHVMNEKSPLNNDDEDDRETRSPNSTANQSGSQSERNDSTVSSQRSGHTLHNCKIVTGLFEIVSILWCMHSVKINEKAREERIGQTLPDIVVSYAPRFISYYKGTMIFKSVVMLCANIPMRVLISNSISLPGECMKKLKTMKVKKEEDFAVLMALVEWGMGGLIIDRVTKWLEDTVAAAEDHWRYEMSEPDEPNSLVVPTIVELLFRHEPMKTDMLTQHYDKILKLWKMMADVIVMRLLYRRILRKTPFSNSQLSDEFLMACFRWYLKMIPLLHKPAPYPYSECDDSTLQRTPQPFDSKAELLSMIQWTEDAVVPYLQVEEANWPNFRLVTNIITYVLYVSDRMVATYLADSSCHLKLGRLSVSLLQCHYNLTFLNGVSRLTKTINSAARADFPVAPQIWTNMVPILVSHMMNAVVAHRGTKDELAPYLKNFDEMNKHTGEILSSYQLHYERTHSCIAVDSIELLASKALFALREVLTHEVPREDKTVPYYSSLASLPTAACVVITPFYKSDFWTAIFLRSLMKNVGTTPKVVLIDLIIIHLFKTRWARVYPEVCDAAEMQLRNLKTSRESGTHSLRVTLTHVEAERDDDSEDEESEDEELPRVRATVATRTVDGSRPSEDSETATGSRASSSQPTGSRDSAPNIRFTVGTVTVDGSRPSEVTETTMGSQPQSSQLGEDEERASAEDALLENFRLLGEELLEIIKDF